MNVQPSPMKPEPGYPSRRDVAKSAKALGLAALGASGLLLAGCDRGRFRTGGVIMSVSDDAMMVQKPVVSPRADAADKAATNAPPRLGGVPRPGPKSAP